MKELNAVLEGKMKDIWDRFHVTPPALPPFLPLI